MSKPDDSEPDYRAEMKLPEGARCADCVYVSFCVGIGCTKADATSCDYHPSRFRPRPVSEGKGGPPRVLREKDVFRYEVPPRPPAAPRSRLRVVLDRNGKPWLCGGVSNSIAAADDDDDGPAATPPEVN